MTKPWQAIPAAPERGWSGSLACFREAPHRFCMELAERNGGIGRFRLMHHSFLAISDARLIRQVLEDRPNQYQRSFQYRSFAKVTGEGLLVSEGQHWKHRRAWIVPQMRSEFLRHVSNSTSLVTEKLFKHLTNESQNETIDDLLEFCRQLTIHVIGIVILGRELNTDEAHSLSGSLRLAMQSAQRRNASLLRLPIWIPTSHNRSLVGAKRTVDTLMLATPSLSGTRSDEQSSDLSRKLRNTWTPQGDDNCVDLAIHDELRTLLLAGFETTSAAMAWTLMELSAHPVWQQICQQEADRYFASGSLEPEMLKGQGPLDYVIYESMRLHPPVYQIVRRTNAPDVLGNYRIPSKTLVVLSIYGSHRSPRIWSDPEVFRPDRFEHLDKETRTSFLPFGAGPHLCLGMGAALMEIKVALLWIFRNFHLGKCKLSVAEAGDRTDVTLSPREPVAIEFLRRR